MPIITLTSDWGLKDHYVAAVKGRILTYLPDATIIDITHQIKPFDKIRAAFVIKNSYESFPENTVHIIGVDSEASVATPHLAVYYENHYFIGADNGIFTLIFEKKPKKIIELNIMQDSDYFTFPTRDVFVKAACHLASGKAIEELGVGVGFKNESTAGEPAVNGNIILGSVIYVDSYENLITNIPAKLFKQKFRGKKCTIVLPDKKSIKKLSKSYKDEDETDLVAFFNTSGLLEIAINKGNIASLLALEVGSAIRVEFEE